MRSLARWVLTAAFAVGVAGSAVAQPPGGGRGGMGGGRGVVDVYGIVATNKDLGDELKVTDEQKDKLKEALKPISDKRRAAMTGLGNFRDMSEEERTKAMKEMGTMNAGFTAEMKKAVKGVLDEKQYMRLTQISYQAMGLAAFAEKDVQAALKVTDEQKDKVKAISDELTKDRAEIMRGAFGGAGAAGGDREEMQKKFQEMQKKTAALTKEAEEKVGKLWTEDQVKAWKEMTGAKFDTSKLAQAPMQRKKKDD